MALAKAAGGSGYSANLSTNPTIRKQQLLCDPDEPLSGSTSVQYDASKVSLVGAAPGPGYDNESFTGFVEVYPTIIAAPGGVDAPVSASSPPATALQPLYSFLDSPWGPETGFIQIQYRLSAEGTPGQMSFDEGFTPIAHTGVAGVDTHGLTFLLHEGVPVNANISYTVFAAPAGTHSGNDQDFLETNDGTHTILGPADLSSATVSSSPNVPRAELLPDPSFPTKRALFVFGSEDKDMFRFDKVRGRLQVWDNNTSLGAFSGYTRVIAYGAGGNDVMGLCDAQGLFFGGEGNDIMYLGNTSSIASGGAGNDIIYTGNGADLAIGGLGSDLLMGANGDDILIAGQTSYDAGTDLGVVTLTAILKEWSQGGSYSSRISHITGATAGGLNGSAIFSTSGPLQNVFDDGAQDILIGGRGRDWMLLHRSGSSPLDLSDLNGSEVGTLI